jgi:hypothetical protein
MASISPLLLLFNYLVDMTHRHIKTSEELPGSFPVVIKKKNHFAETKKKSTTIAVKKKNEATGANLRLNLQMGKLKSYFFTSNEQLVVKVEKQHKISKWQKIWSKSEKKHEQESEIIKQKTNNTVAVGTVFSLSVPITISNTTTHFHTTTTKSEKVSASSSIIQQIIILPPTQIYGLMLIVVLFLIVLAFAILQIHRSISILEATVEGVKYVLVGLASNSISLFVYLKSWF